MKKYFILIFFTFVLYSYSDSVKKERQKIEVLEAFSRVRLLVNNKEVMFFAQNKKNDPQNIEWINKRLFFIYDINKIILDEIHKVLYNNDIDSSLKSNALSLYINPLYNSINPKTFSYYQSISMTNNDDIKYILHTSTYSKKGDIMYSEKLSHNSIFAIWITLLNAKFFDCKYQDDHVNEKLKELYRKGKISETGILLLSNIDNFDVDIKKYIDDKIFEENNPMWIENKKYVDTMYDLYRYVYMLRENIDKEKK